MFPRNLQEAVEFYATGCAWGIPVSLTYQHSATTWDSWNLVCRRPASIHPVSITATVTAR